MKSGYKINIYVADEIHPDGIKLLKNKFNVVKLTGHNNRRLINLIFAEKTPLKKNSALIIRSARKLDKNSITEIHLKTDIKLICTVSSGFDNIDINECRKRKIDVINVLGGNSISAGEFTLALILASAKNLIIANDDMNKGTFDNTRSMNIELFGKTIGIIGVGRVGSYVARLSHSFGMKILGNDINKKLITKYKRVKFVSLNTLLKSSDIITLHIPLNETTRRLINRNNIKLIAKNSILINCSRGGTIDEAALINALKKNKIRYAGIDVFEKEPDFNKDFLKLKNVILSPHFAGKTVESRKRMAVISAGKIIKYFSGNRKTLKLVN